MIKPYFSHTRNEAFCCRTHDRAQPKVLKWYHRRNINVARAPMKEQRLREGDSIFSTTDFNWAELTTMRHTTDALLNFGMVSQLLWPYDMSALIFLKLYNTYGWFSHVNVSEKKRVALVCDHFERVMSANADRAVSRFPPCTYDEMEKLLKGLLGEEGVSQYPPVFGGQEDSVNNGQASGQGQGQNNPARQQRGARQNGGGGNNGGNNSGGSTGNNKPPAVTPSGGFVCFAFNKPRGCSNTPIANGGGCRNQQGKEFVHVCQYYYPATRMYCLKQHPRHQHV